MTFFIIRMAMPFQPPSTSPVMLSEYCFHENDEYRWAFMAISTPIFFVTTPLFLTHSHTLHTFILVSIVRSDAHNFLPFSFRFQREIIFCLSQFQFTNRRRTSHAVILTFSKSLLIRSASCLPFTGFLLQKNRFSNILLFSEGAVVLEVTKHDKSQNTYIHATKIKSKFGNYVLAQVFLIAEHSNLVILERPTL